MKIALVSPYDFAYPGGVVNHISALEQYFTKMGHELKSLLLPQKLSLTSVTDSYLSVNLDPFLPAVLSPVLLYH